MVLRWGIVGAGKISHDFVSALHTQPADRHQVVGVAARSLSSAKDFAEKHAIPKAFGGYEALAKDKDFDVAYIGVLIPQHFPVSKLMLEHGKHVLCEKPLTINKKEAQELVELAKAKKLFFMQAVWSRCFPLYEQIRTIIDSGTIGEVLQVNADFGCVCDDIDRLNFKEMGGSAILDLGVYVLQFSQFIHKAARPVSFIPWGHVNQAGVDDRAGAIVTYPGGKFSVVTCNSRADLANTAHVYGTKGTIIVPTFWCPTSFTLKPTGGSTFQEKTYEGKLPKTNATFNFTNSAGLAHEAEEVRTCIEKGLLESPKISSAETLQLAELMDAWRKAAGNIFPQDK